MKLICMKKNFQYAASKYKYAKKKVSSPKLLSYVIINFNFCYMLHL